MRRPAATFIAGLGTLAALVVPAVSTASISAKVGADGNRTIEAVSTPHRDGAIISGMLSTDGSRVFYTFFGGSDEAVFGSNAQLLADRAAGGWVSSSPLPPRSALSQPQAGANGASKDLTRFTVKGLTEFGLGVDQFAAYEPATGVLSLGPRYSAADVASNRRPMVEGLLSDDARVNVRRYGATELFYEVSRPEPVVVSVLPDGTPPACGTYDYLASSAGSLSQHMLSIDGSRLVFVSQGDDCSGPMRLYQRQGMGPSGITRVISGVPIAGPDPDDLRFNQASPDGSQVFFTTSARLTGTDGNTTRDAYRWQLDAGLTCITCSVADANVGVNTDLEASSSMVVAENGDRAYFTSTNVLAAGAAAGTRNLYVWRAVDGVIDFVAPSGMLIGSSAAQDAMATPDGAVLAFRSRRSELDVITGRSNGGRLQYYRYNDRDGSLTCVTCPSGPATADLSRLPRPNTFAPLSAVGLTRDGRSFVFETGDALVAKDVNKTSDIYEWHDGRVGLITDGTGLTQNILYDVSADGRDVLFGSYSRLAPGVTHDYGTLYTARVGGGFPEAAAVVPCEGDTCQGALTVRPAGGVISPPAGGASAAPGARDAFVVSRMTAVQRRALARGRAVDLKVQATRRGMVSVTGRARIAGRSRLVLSGSRSANGPGVVMVRVRLSALARTTLRQRRYLAVTISGRLSGLAKEQRQSITIRSGR